MNTSVYMLGKDVFWLAVVLLLIIAGSYIYKRFFLGSMGRKGGLIRVVSTSLIGPKKYIAIVNVVDRYMVLGISGERITYLSSIDTSDSIDRLEELMKTESDNRVSWFGRRKDGGR